MKREQNFRLYKRKNGKVFRIHRVEGDRRKHVRGDTCMKRGEECHRPPAKIQSSASFIAKKDRRGFNEACFG